MNVSAPRVTDAGIALALVAWLLAPAPAPGQAARAAGDVEASIRAMIDREMRANDLPGFALALVRPGAGPWFHAAGVADPAAPAPASAATIWRAGSISKLFTALAVMRLVEAGRLDLDRPVEAYLPELRLENPFGEPVTLRRLMSHTAGLVREPPAGSYFDAAEPDLAATVASLSGTRLVVRPGETVKYSNAAVALAGRIVEVVSGEPFADHVLRRFLRPIGMPAASFARGAAPAGRLATGVMWTLDGRRFAAPTFDLGMAPAGSLYASVEDLAAFARWLLVRGRTAAEPILAPETLESMWDPANGAGKGRRVGLGFTVSSLGGRRTVGHAGAIYGFATSLIVLPDDGIAVAAATNLDAANPIVEAIARHAALSALAVSRGESLPSVETPDPLSSRARYRPADPASPRPAPCPPSLRPLIGHYGFDHNVLYLREEAGRLHALIEWFFDDVLTEAAPDRFVFPDAGLYAREELRIERDAAGRVTGVLLSGLRFPRRAVAPEDGSSFRIRLLRPVEDLRREATAAAPPPGLGGTRAPDLADVTTLDPTLRLDIRYATTNNFMGATFYATARAFLQRPAADALARVQRALAPRGFGLLIHDAYRPWSVTKMFYEATPPELRHFVADPGRGSRHNRGAAVDLTLCDLATGRPAVMPGGYDEMTERSHPTYRGGTSEERWLRDLLRSAMEAEGFAVYEFEWWHFDYRDWREYPVLNVPFEKL